MDTNNQPTNESESVKPTQEAAKPVVDAPGPKGLSLYDLDNMTDAEVATEAKKWGAIPKEDWKDDPSKFQDARTFLKNSIQKTPAHLNQIKKQDKIIDTLKVIVENQKAENERLRIKLDRNMKEAFEGGDYEKFQTLQAEKTSLENNYNNLDSLKETQDIEYPQQSAAPDLDIADWITKHPDYTMNTTFAQGVDTLYNAYKAKYPFANNKQILGLIDSTLEKNNNKGAAVSDNTFGNQAASSISTSVPQKKTFDNLTDSAKKTCLEIEKRGLKREDFIQFCNDACFIWGNK